jgi:LmbE family N-acetylglucosaminyl deacetylase
MIAASVRAAARGLLLRVARDVTETVVHRSALVIAPHPDDETLGCGGRVLLSRRAGTPVTVVVVGDGHGSHRHVGGAADELRRRRRAELTAACALLGVEHEDVCMLGYPDDAMAGRIDEIAAQLERLIRATRPDDVYVTCSEEPHPDHAAVAVAARRAVARIEPTPRLLEYPIWLWSDWPLSRRFRDGSGLRRFGALARHRSIEIVRLEPVRAEKRRALAEYRSQLGEVDLVEAYADYGSPTGSVALPPIVVRRAVTGPELFFVEPTRMSARRTYAAAQPRTRKNVQAAIGKDKAS